MRRTLLLPLAALFLVAGKPRPPEDPKHENHFSGGTPPASDAVGLVLEQAQAQQEFIQVGVKISNKSTDKLVVLKKGESEFVTPAGSYKPQPSALFGGPLVVQPGDSRGHTFKVDGASGFHVDSFTLKPAGFYTGPNSGTPVSAPDFPLPPSQNDFKAGPFACMLKDRKQTTDLTEAVFVCTYNGTHVAIVDAGKLGVRAAGKEFANARKSKRDFVFPGQDTKLILHAEIDKKVVDMQFATLEVLWRDALSEVALTPVGLGDWAFLLDPAKTAEANR